LGGVLYYLKGEIMQIGEINFVISKINEESYDKFEGSEFFTLSYTSDGKNIKIEFLGESIWESYDDARDFDEDKNEYEPLETFLKREINKMIDSLQQQKK
jgi:hypothetical protein